jgi:hypothetical protein
MEYVTRLRKAFGIQWAIIPQGMPKFMKDSEMIYWGFYLVIEGKLSGFAIGEQKYQPTNPTMTYGDACEGAKSNALMRLCKGLGMSLELWKPSFVKKWREKYAETYVGVYPDGKPMKDKFGKPKLLWRKKGISKEIDLDANGEVIPPVDETPPPPEDLKAIHETSSKKASEYCDRMLEIKNKFELKNWWVKHYKDMEKELLPEHMAQVTELKNSLKEKLEEGK